MKAKSSIGPSENEIQASFFEWLDYVAVKNPEVALFYAIPNGSYKSPAARAMFKRTGLKSGVPDCHLPVSGYMGDVAPIEKIAAKGLWIEFKSKRGVLSEAQKVWIEALRSQGHRVEVCRDLASAANATIEYLNLKFKKL